MKGGSQGVIETIFKFGRLQHDTTSSLKTNRNITRMDSPRKAIRDIVFDFVFRVTAESQ
jgi:hypothetical protein